jgi:GNAT superfamily N-acetyltransferase
MDGMLIRKIQDADFAAMLAIINDAAQAYRGVIPANRWREPYMPDDELAHEIADGVLFWGAEQDGQLSGVMGMQDKGEVTLIRHAYVMQIAQGKGIGTRLLRHVSELTSQPILVGTWAAAAWAIEFYRRRGFILVPQQHKDGLLRKYWSIPERQVASSVVLADGCWM